MPRTGHGEEVAIRAVRRLLDNQFVRFCAVGASGYAVNLAVYAALLEVEVGQPVLRQSRRALSGEKVVEVSRSVYRADRFTMWVQLGQEV